MEHCAGCADTVILLDHYDERAQALCASFRAAGCSYPVVVINDDGWLPPEVRSPYRFFCGEGEQTGRGRYFNEIPVPDYWEIRASGRGGSIYDLTHERARIFYHEPLQKRMVSRVDWLDAAGKVRASDYYDRNGRRYAMDTCDAAGRRIVKSWFSPEGKEVLTENYVTGDLILNVDETVWFFKNRTEFVCTYLRETGLGSGRLFYNSLSIPFFVSQQLGAGDRQDVLFWQEPVGEQIPGNMQIILSGRAARTGRICVQLADSYARLLALGAPSDQLTQLGFVYSFARKSAKRKDVLICTNSDRVAHLKELAARLPMLQFHVLAVTEMSARLMALAGDNVRLYPCASAAEFDRLFAACDLYLDINHEAEIADAVHRAFLNEQLILGFSETLHRSEFAAAEHVFAEKDWERLVSALAEVCADDGAWELALNRQRKRALSESAERYQM